MSALTSISLNHIFSLIVQTTHLSISKGSYISLALKEMHQATQIIIQQLKRHIIILFTAFCQPMSSRSPKKLCNSLSLQNVSRLPNSGRHLPVEGSSSHANRFQTATKIEIDLLMSTYFSPLTLRRCLNFWALGLRY